MDGVKINEDYENAKRKAKALYSKIGRVWCPALSDYVSFNGMGFRHLVRKRGVPRSKKEQKRRFALLPFAEEIVRKSEVVVVRKEKETAQLAYRHQKREVNFVLAEFYSFVGNRNGRIVTVVVRRFEGGEKHFLSVY